MKFAMISFFLVYLKGIYFRVLQIFTIREIFTGKRVSRVLRALTIVKKSLLIFDDKTFVFCSGTYPSKENLIKSYFHQFPYESNGKYWKVDVKTTLIKR